MNDLRATLTALREKADDLHRELYALAVDIDTIPDADGDFVLELWNAEEMSFDLQSALKIATERMEAHE